MESVGRQRRVEKVAARAPSDMRTILELEREMIAVPDMLEEGGLRFDQRNSHGLRWKCRHRRTAK